MTMVRIAAAAAAVIAATAVTHAQQGNGTTPVPEAYSGAEATGDHVLGLWQFTAGSETADASGHGHSLTLRGRSLFVPEGLFGSCLESFPAGSDNDVAVGAQADDHDALSPEGAFSLELWFNPKPELDQQETAFLIDKKYFHYAKDLPEANTDYCLYLQRRAADTYVLTASLGFGGDSVWGSSERIELRPGTWYHLGFSYDGDGVSRFFVNGQAVGRAIHEGRRAITPGRHALVIGDRVGSTYTGCPGTIDQVRLCRGVLPQFAGSLDVSVRASRTAFRRMEAKAAVTLWVENDTSEALTDVRVVLHFGDDTQTETFERLEPKSTRQIVVPVDTGLKVGVYPLTVDARALSVSRAYREATTLDIHIVPRPAPESMPVVMWGGGEFEQLTYVGFTHQLDSFVDYAKIWDAGKPTQAMSSSAMETAAQRLNDYLIAGLQACVYLYPGRWVADNESLKRYLRVDRAGATYPGDNVSASHPDVQAYGYNVGASVAQTFGTFPALTACLVHSEIRDGTALSFHDFEKRAARKALGFDIPPQATSKGGISLTALPEFPRDQVIPDDDPILRFYSWFWKNGDGWNPLHTRVHEGLKSTGRGDLWTFFDPAVRVPSVWGSGGKVDVISQWTYSYPDPIKIGQATDELFAMAAGQPGQQVMKMTQIIWYRSGTAPTLPEDEAARAPWEKEIPDAQFITISPDHMREAFWSKMSRPIRGIMYHGMGSLYPVATGSYKHTNPLTREVLRELIHDVVQPLGPTLLNVPDRPADVAILESFSSQVYAGRGSYGWSASWEARMHLILQWASLQPSIIYDEHVVRDGLDDIKVLVMPACDVLTATVVDTIKAFQAHGGLVVADENLCPAISPDIVIPSCGGTGEAHERKAEMLAAAARLRAELDAFYERYADSDNPEVVPRVRSVGSADYLFAVNDYRTYGDYVGHHRLVMEQGLPSKAVLSLRRRRGTVYDLVAHCEIPATSEDGWLQIPLDFGPGEGRLLLVTGRPLAGIDCDVPRRAQRGESIVAEIRVKAGLLSPPDAIMPIQLTVTDPAENEAEGTGFYAAPEGRLNVTLDLAPNDEVGTWRVTARDLASGRTATATFDVQ